MSPIKPTPRTTPLILMVVASFVCLPTCGVLAYDHYPTMTVLNSRFEITNRNIENNATFLMTGTGLISAQDIGNGLYQIEDDFSTVKNDNLGVYAPYIINLTLDSTSFNVRMVGKKLGHSFNVVGRYYGAEVRLNNMEFVVGKDGINIYQVVNKTVGNCNSIYSYSSSGFNLAIVGNTANTSMTCSNANAGNGAAWYLNKMNKNSISSLQPIKRDILLDIGGLQKNADYRKAPPDTYVGTVTSDVQHSFIFRRYEVPVAEIMVYRNNITIQKNPYFEGITLPAGDNFFDVKKVSNKLKGNLTIPYVMNGQFTPYNTINLEVASNNGFKLKDASNNEIPYSLSTTIGVRKLNIADKGTTVNPQSVIAFTDLSKEFYALQGRFDADFSASSSIQTGDYTDTVTAVYTISL